MRLIIPLLLLILLPGKSLSQCFSSAGNPVGGSGNIGVLDKKTLSVVGFYRHFVSDRYFEGDQVSEVSLIKNAGFNFAGVLIGFGLTNKLTLESELGYVINKTKKYRFPEGYSLTGRGWSNGTLSAKYQLWYNPDKKVEISASTGLKFPFSLNSQSVNNVRLPFDLQPSTSTFGLIFQGYLIKQDSYTGMRYFLFHRTELNSANRDGYRSGNLFVNAVFISRHLIRTSSWPVSGTLILQLRSEVRGRSFIHKEIESSSGSVKFIVSPQLNLAFVEKWNLSMMIDLTVYQHYNNVQLADKFGFTVVLIRPILL